jgi:hypothetical protein
MTALHRIYRNGTEFERDCEALMRFQLTYDGPLYSNNPDPGCDDGTPAAKRRLERHARKAEHKHDIRRKLHPQLKKLWETHKPLQRLVAPTAAWDVFPSTVGVDWTEPPSVSRPLVAVLSDVYAHHKAFGYRYVPLAWKENHLEVSLRILCLRHDHAGALLPGRDIDNRIKTLIDALTMPGPRQVPPRNGKPRRPTADEKPFFVLMDDDRRVSHLEVQTANDLGKLPRGVDDSYVRLVISVETRAIYTTMFNLGFA